MRINAGLRKAILLCTWVVSIYSRAKNGGPSNLNILIFININILRGMA